MRYGSPLSISGSYEHLQASAATGQVAFWRSTIFADSPISATKTALGNDEKSICSAVSFDMLIR